ELFGRDGAPAPGVHASGGWVISHPQTGCVTLMRASDRQACCCVDCPRARMGGTIGQGFRPAGHSGRLPFLQEIRRRESGVVRSVVRSGGGMIMGKLNDGSLRQEPAAAGPRAMIVSA